MDDHNLIFPYFTLNVESVRSDAQLFKRKIDKEPHHTFDEMVNYAQCSPQALKRTISYMSRNLGLYSGIPEGDIVDLNDSRIVQELGTSRGYLENTEDTTGDVREQGDTRDVREQRDTRDVQQKEDTEAGSENLLEELEENDEIEEDETIGDQEVQEEVKKDPREDETRENQVQEEDKDSQNDPLLSFNFECDESGQEIISIDKIAQKSGLHPLCIERNLYRLALLDVQEEAQIPDSSKIN